MQWGDCEMTSLEVLLLGGTGTISAACALAALAAGHRVTVLNRGQSTRPLPAGVSRVLADVRDTRRLRSIVASGRFEVVADFLSYTPEEVSGTLDAVGTNLRQYIFVSSASAYEKPPAQVPVTERTPLRNAYWQYARDKIACEEVVQAAREAHGLPATVVRPSHTYDERRLPTLGGWTDIARLRAGKPVVVPGDGTSLWTMTHADDVAVAVTGLLGHPQAIGEAFTITGDETPTWNQVYELLAAAAGVESPALVHVASETLAAWLPDWGPRLLGDRAHSMVFDNRKIKALVPGFHTSVTLGDGVRRMLAYYDADPSQQVVDAGLSTVLDALTTTIADVQGSGRALAAQREAQEG